MSKNKVLIISGITILILIYAIGFSLIFRNAKSKSDNNQDQKNISAEISSDETEKDRTKHQERYAKATPNPDEDEYPYDYYFEFEEDTWFFCHETNNAFIAEGHFDSGNFTFDLMQTSDPEYYLNRNLRNYISSSGTPFIMSDQDFRNDRNVVIYSNETEEGMLHPLTELTDQDFYQKNRTFTLYLEDGMEHYLITNVVAVSRNDLQDYTKYNFDESQFEYFANVINSNNKITAGQSISYGDRLATIILRDTATEDGYIVAVAKMIESGTYFGEAVG